MLIKFHYGNDKYCYFNNKLQPHRLNNLTCENMLGTKWWYKNGFFHREDGPAIEFSKNYKYYYLNGTLYQEKEYWEIIRFGAFA